MDGFVPLEDMLWNVQGMHGRLQPGLYMVRMLPRSAYSPLVGNNERTDCTGYWGECRAPETPDPETDQPHKGYVSEKNLRVEASEPAPGQVGYHPN